MVPKTTEAAPVVRATVVFVAIPVIVWATPVDVLVRKEPVGL